MSLTDGLELTLCIGRWEKMEFEKVVKINLTVNWNI